MKQIVILLAILVLGLLLFTIGTRPAPSTPSSGKDGAPPPFPKGGGRKDSAAARQDRHP